MRYRAFPLLLLALLGGCGSSSDTAQPAPSAGASFAVASTAVFAHAEKDQIYDCASTLCRHNENTDLIRWKDAIYLVHRTAAGQGLGPNSSLRVLRSVDEGKTFELTAVIPAPQGPLAADDTGKKGRDIRDPSFYVAGGKLHIKALARLPVASVRDADVDTRSVYVTTEDGKTFTPYAQMAPPGYSIWRVKEKDGTFHAAAYTDGDKAIALFSSPNGVDWKQGATVYDKSADTPLEPQIVFMPSGKMLVYFRLDGTDAEILGNTTLRTRLCWADAPYTAFDCSQQVDGQRLDGPVDFFVGDRLFVIARKHLGADGRKRTAVFEMTGNLEGGPLAVVERAELPSAGDTAYAGVVKLANGSFLTTWYASDLASDPTWAIAMALGTDIWRGELTIR